MRFKSLKEVKNFWPVYFNLITLLIDSRPVLIYGRLLEAINYFGFYNPEH
jgi:hypothetical protein